MNTLLEIGTEHLPARFVMPSLEQLKTHTEAILQEKRISFESVETFGTYRRLVVMINGIADKAADIQKEVKGPPAKLLKDAKPDQAVLALKSYETMASMADGQATKLIIPSDLKGIATLGTTLSEVLEKKEK